MSADDVRLQQLFSNNHRALGQREQQGLIKAFEYSFELACISLRDLPRSQSNVTLTGSRNSLHEAFRLGLIEEGEAWMLMIQDRNLTSQTYNRPSADINAALIVKLYVPCFQHLRSTLEKHLKQEEQEG